MRLVFPDRPIVEIADEDPIFHAVYDLDDRYQIPGQWALMRGTTYRNDGARAYWRGIYDEHGRLMVAMDFNSDVGDHGNGPIRRVIPRNIQRSVFASA